MAYFVLSPLLEIHLDRDQNITKVNFLPRATKCLHFENVECIEGNPEGIHLPSADIQPTSPPWMISRTECNCNVMVF